MERNRLAAIFITIVSAITGCSKHAPPPAHQQAGWTNTRWGMTEQQVRDLYPQALTEQQNQNPKGYQASLTVDKFQLDGQPLTLRFFFDSAGGLHEVHLYQYIKNKIDCISMRSTRDHLEELLNQKYGKPSTVRTEQQDRHIVWNATDVIVSLDYLNMELVNSCELSINYKRPESDTLDHL